jgi:hypothetical protein
MPRLRGVNVDRHDIAVLALGIGLLDLDRADFDPRVRVRGRPGGRSAGPLR